MPNLFEGKRTRLRAYEPEDVETMRRHLLDTEISRYDSEIWYPYSRGAVLTSAENKGKVNFDSDDQSLVIETIEGKLIGGICVHSANRTQGTFEIGLGIADRAEWGKGYAKEAMLLMMRFLFHERRYQKCNLGVYAFNERAMGLYRHLGFIEEGRKRRACFTAGRFHDEVIMGITREEFDAKHPDWMLEP